MSENKEKNIFPVLILANIRSVHNVGSLFRTADAAGVKKMYLCGVTPTPIDRFGRARTDIAKVALGAEVYVPWEHVPDVVSLCNQLKEQGYHICALEQDSNSVDYRTSKILKGKKLALLLGEETKGIPQEILQHADVIIEIPMQGKKESLNVAVAGGIALFRLLEN